MACGQILRVDIGSCDWVPALNVVPTFVFISHPNSRTGNGWHKYEKEKIKQHSRYDKEQTKSTKRRCQRNIQTSARLDNR
jgi:hypothetical protein